MQEVAFDPNLSYTPKINQMNQFQNYLKETAPLIDKWVDIFLSAYLDKSKEISPKLVKYIKLFQEASKGGKRLRGVLVKLGYEIGDHNFKEEVFKVAVAFEIVQTAILSHDDIIDQSSLRRGKPTIYKKLGGDHYAISQTIALGDAAFFLANRLITESNFTADRKNKALNYFNEMMLRTCLGEMLDVEVPLQKDIKDQEVLIISKFKTAWYTVIGPLSVGAILSGADDKLPKIEEFGKNLGIAFQIQDDLLGVFGSSEQTGKSITSDLEEGKATFLISYAQKRANTKQREYLLKYYGRKNLTKEQAEKIREIFIESGALDFCKKKCIKYAEAAKSIILDITNDQKMAKLLESLSDYLIERKF